MQQRACKKGKESKEKRRTGLASSSTSLVVVRFGHQPVRGIEAVEVRHRVPCLLFVLFLQGAEGGALSVNAKRVSSCKAKAPRDRSRGGTQLTLAFCRRFSTNQHEAVHPRVRSLSRLLRHVHRFHRGLLHRRPRPRHTRAGRSLCSVDAYTAGQSCCRHPRFAPRTAPAHIGKHRLLHALFTPLTSGLP